MSGTWINRIQEEFEFFHLTNPRIYDLFVMFARELKNKGYEQGSSKLIFERIRWEVMITTTTQNEDFKLNNNFSSRYARLVMAQEPDLADFFETRRLKNLEGVD